VAGSATEDDVINFALPGTAPWTVNLTAELPDLTTNIEIVGPGADQLTVRRDAVNDFRIFTVIGDTTEVTISGMTISNGKVADNTNGGGILIADSGTLMVTDSTVSGNSAGGDGGGGISSNNEIPDTDPANDPDETTTITNSTISGNTVTGEGAIGGGVYNNFDLTVIENSTITNNTAPDGLGSGVANRRNAEFTRTEVLSSIISANTNTDVDFFTNFGTPTNTFVSNGYNLIGDGNATGAFNQPTDQLIESDPNVGALSDNGGLTQTHALLTDSPAIDAGPPTDGDPIVCPPPLTDQRGVSRP
jgi:hypothetical protein